MHRAVRLINPLFQTGDKIIDQIIGEMKVLPQIIGDKVDIFFEVAAEDIGGVWLCKRLEKRILVEVIVTDELGKGGVVAG